FAGGFGGTVGADAPHLPPGAAAIAGSLGVPPAQLLASRGAARRTPRCPDRHRDRATRSGAHCGALLGALRASALLRPAAHGCERLVLPRSARRGPEHGWNRAAAACGKALRRIRASHTERARPARWSGGTDADAALPLE